MEKNFSSLPTFEQFAAAFDGIASPYEVIIEQLDSPFASYIHYHRQNRSISELYDLISCDQDGVHPNTPFSVDIYTFEPLVSAAADDDGDHPSLSAEERNPSMVTR
jgi:hypothetical protein